MRNLLERTFCPYCSTIIVREFNEKNRLFGNTVTCESRICAKEFVVNASQVYDKGDSLEGSASVREVIRVPKTIAEIDNGQSTLEEFV